MSKKKEIRPEVMRVGSTAGFELISNSWVFLLLERGSQGRQVISFGGCYCSTLKKTNLADFVCLFCLNSYKTA